jgi:hypothetical protein
VFGRSAERAEKCGLDAQQQPAIQQCGCYDANQKRHDNNATGEEKAERSERVQGVSWSRVAVSAPMIAARRAGRVRDGAKLG